MEKNILYNNYLKSLEQKYYAVCFDIDGTLTIPNSKNIDDRAIDMIIQLLKKKVPVVFITGRGETGLNDLIDDIYDKIVGIDSITDKDLKRIFVLTNDGARLFYSQETTRNKFLQENTYISTKEELDQLIKINEMLLELKKQSKFSNMFDIAYSKDSITNQIINVRMVFKTEDNSTIDSMLDCIRDLIKENNLNEVYLSRGKYRGKSVIQAATAKKDMAIERTEKIIGVPKDSMIRIGDCGDLRGNDYAMLNCQQGYSVDKTSNSLNSCFPIFDENGNVITGVDATLHLINQAKILPTVCLEKADKEVYQHNFAKVERNIVLGRKKLLEKYNDIINNNFNYLNGIDDVFDKSSGSIKIPMFEMELLVESPLKDFWLTKIDNNLAYSLRDDRNYLLRGSKTYYYLLANRVSDNGNDKTTKEDIMNLYENYSRFLLDAQSAVSNSNNLNDLINKKLILGILDNCRNVLLLLLNKHLVLNYLNKNVLLDISSGKTKEVNEIYLSLMEIELMMSKICFGSNYLINKNEVIEVISKTRIVVNNNYMQEYDMEEIPDYSKSYRAYREIDNFGENYIAVSLYKEKTKTNAPVSACGLSYGGIELPILAGIINQEKTDKLLLLKFNKEVSGYTNKQLLDLRLFNILNYGGVVNANELKGTNVDLFDDNVLTGKTMQLAINSLYDSGIMVNNICIVRYPSINRIDQMFVENPTAVDYNLFFDYIYGLCFNSPYSWKDDNWRNARGWIDYTDSLGVFDLNRKKIIECILKNHDFNSLSEVGEYKRRLIK